MSDSVLIVENLCKKYLVGHKTGGPGSYRYTALRDVIGRGVRNASRKAVDLVRGRPVLQGDQIEEFWALKDISFEVKRGEVLGIIGRNGAGKSTLLKILSRITEPTHGRVTIQGRVASLLEVGTGFHPELTGRENIFLNGAILGMARREIKKKFDEIVAFAEVERFIDTPVKHYSSGMYVRLAFAVAAHLEPEILVIDEVLAVGDSEFQQKCLGKMDEVSRRDGRTVLFVSHNMSVVAHLCERVILLRKGKIASDDVPQATLARYLSDAVDCASVNLEDWSDRQSSGEARIIRLEFDDGEGDHRIFFGGTFRIRLWARFYKRIKNPIFGVVIHDSAGIPITNPLSIHSGLSVDTDAHEMTVEMTTYNFSLYPGKYILSAWISDSTNARDIDFVRLCATFEIHPSRGLHSDLKLHPAWGRVYMPSQWSVQYLNGGPEVTEKADLKAMI